MSMGKLEVLWVRRSALFKFVSTVFVVATVAATMGQYSGPKLWWEAGDTENLPLSASFPDRTGELLLYNYDGPVAARHSSFFQPLGTNGRACVTCHQPSNAMSLSTETCRSAGKRPRARTRSLPPSTVRTAPTFRSRRRVLTRCCSDAASSASIFRGQRSIVRVLPSSLSSLSRSSAIQPAAIQIPSTASTALTRPSRSTGAPAWSPISSSSWGRWTAST